MKISEEKCRLLILYGSQTGTSQDLAEHIWRESRKRNFTGPVMAMDDYDIRNLINEKLVVFVCSTTGQGDEPDNMRKFWRFLLRKSLPSDSLVEMEYGVLALGDSSYAKYNFVGKKLHKRLSQLSAKSILPLGLCDDQHDLGPSAVYLNWIQALWKELSKMNPSCNVISNEIGSKWQFRWKVERINPKTTDIDCSLLEWPLKEDKFSMVLRKNVRTTNEEHFQDVRLLSFEVDGKVNWEPGDVVAVKPQNADDKVSRLFKLFAQHDLEFDDNTVVAIRNIDPGPQAGAAIGGVGGGANTANSQDDEYRYAGCEDPKIMITTSHDPSARLKMFVKELRLIFPNAQRMNRGKYEMKQLIHACRANDVTDFIVVHEHRGVPDNLVICHLPHGPTAFFNISGVVMRHDVPDVGPMSEQKPHLIFHNFKTKLGERAMSVLKYLFPVPKEDSKRVITFANHDDYICFRHHTFQYVNKELELKEVGPRFQLKLYQIKLGTLDELDAADTEWVLRPYMNTSAKRRFLSDDDGWVQDDPDVDMV